MKQIAFFLMLASCLASNLLMAQTLEFGLYAGAGNLSIEWPKNTYFSRGDYTIKPQINAGAELSWVSRGGFGVRGGLLYSGRAVECDSVNVYPASAAEYHSEVEVKASTLFIPLQLLYRIPLGKFYTQLSAGVLPGFLLSSEVSENLIIKTNFPNRDMTAIVEYNHKFEIGIIGEARIAYQVAPKVNIGLNASYLSSELDIFITPDDGTPRGSIDQSSKGMVLALSASFSLK